MSSQHTNVCDLCWHLWSMLSYVTCNAIPNVHIQWAPILSVTWDVCMTTLVYSRLAFYPDTLYAYWILDKSSVHFSRSQRLCDTLTWAFSLPLYFVLAEVYIFRAFTTLYFDEHRCVGQVNSTTMPMCCLLGYWFTYISTHAGTNSNLVSWVGRNPNETIL